MIHLWTTSHEISDHVMRQVRKAFMTPLRHASLLSNEEMVAESIGYGILRGLMHIFRRCEKKNVDWWELDNGYFKRGHFQGYYRVSKNNLTANFDEKMANSLFDDRFEALGIPVLPWREPNASDHILICPPTESICEFFDLGECFLTRKEHQDLVDSGRKIILRKKGDPTPLKDHLTGCYAVVTHSSNVGVDALLLGIPAITKNHTINQWNNLKTCDITSYTSLIASDRRKLFNYMANCQFTLAELAKSETWDLIFKIQGGKLQR